MCVPDTSSTEAHQMKRLLLAVLLAVTGCATKGHVDEWARIVDKEFQGVESRAFQQSEKVWSAMGDLRTRIIVLEQAEPFKQIEKFKNFRFMKTKVWFMRPGSNEEESGTLYGMGGCSEPRGSEGCHTLSLFLSPKGRQTIEIPIPWVIRMEWVGNKEAFE